VEESVHEDLKDGCCSVCPFYKICPSDHSGFKVWLNQRWD
jgi:hypothetical protein